MPSDPPPFQVRSSPAQVHETSPRSYGRQRAERATSTATITPTRAFDRKVRGPPGNITT
jgi:hypothetical protein